ncbi:MAG TPA: NADH-ubiquinone oxidoreductase-F iron-sulfur binding region domain-containing protein [Actinomycetota bacterium]|nr:NADH-ubiquinone oxidoreductase-F iron-sulfur binding region domain-containing protein [Actinomycetota bacterium]
MSLIDHPCESLDAYRAAGGLSGLEAALSASPDDVIATVVESGLRGRGGGGFPTGEKWDAIRNVGSGDRYVVCNAAEGEPATFKDRYLLRTNPYQVLEGILIAAYAVGAAGAYIGLKEAFTSESDALVRAAQEMHDAGVADPVPIEIVSGPDLYLLGEETGLLEVVEGRPPLPRSHRPYMEGLFAAPPKENPTLVNNAETLANVPHILRQGPDWLRASGTERSPGTMLFTLTGDVEREGVFELPLGTPLRALVEEAGGGVRGGGAMKVIVPGSSTTALVASQLDVGLDFEDMAATGSGLGSGGFAVFDDTTCIVQVAHLYSRFLWVESCAQCPPCKFGSGEITAHLERIERGEGDAGDVGLMLARAKTVTDGQKCALPTGESLLVQSLIQMFTEEFQAHERRRCDRYRDGLALPKIVDFDEDAGRFRYDETYRRKQPDWTFASPAD